MKFPREVKCCFQFIWVVPAEITAGFHMVLGEENLFPKLKKPPKLRNK